MRGLAGAAADVRLTRRSPSGAVTIVATRRAGIVVSIDPKRIRDHDEFSLAEEIEDVTRSVWAAFAEERDKLAAERNLAAVREVPTWQQDMLAEFRAIEVIGWSSERHVEAGLYDGEELFLKFHGNVVRRTDIPVGKLEREVTKAITDAGRRYLKAENEIRARYRRRQSVPQ